MKSINILFFSLFFTAFVHAQDALTPRGSSYFFLGVNVPIVKVRDDGHSSLIYRGINSTLRLGYERVGTDIVSRITFSFSGGEIKPKTHPQPEKHLSKAEINTIEVSYAYYRRMGNAYDTEGGKPLCGRCRLLFI